MFKISVTNQKGGVGKTVTTVNVGAALAQAGKRVLLVDLDPQGHLTDNLGLPHATEPATLANALLGDWSGELGDLIAVYRDNIHVIPTHPSMFLLEPQMYGAKVRNREQRLSKLLRYLDDAYDFCLIDCPPSLGALTDNGLVATGRRRGERGPFPGGVLIPVQAEDSTLNAIKLLFQQISTVEHEMELDLDIIGMVINLYDGRRGRIATSTRSALHSMEGVKVVGEIGDRTVVREGWRLHLPVVEHDPKSDAAHGYTELADYIVKHAGVQK